MERTREQIYRESGLLTRAALASRWGISRQRTCELSEREDFPAPALVIGRSKLYHADECDQWRAQDRPPGRPAAR